MERQNLNLKSRQLRLKLRLRFALTAVHIIGETTGAAAETIGSSVLRSRRFPTFFAKARKFLFKSQKNLLRERGPASHRILLCRGGIWFICRRSSTLACHVRSSPRTSVDVCER